MHLIGQKILAILCMFIFPATEICAELCCQSTWGHLPQLQLSAKFEPWMKHWSVFDMKQQYILKLILIRVSLCSVQVPFRNSGIPCFIDGLLLYVAYLSSGFGNSKMVTECELKPISMNFGSPRREEGGRGSCVEGMVQDWIGQKKKTILATISYLFLLQ